jgi:hypothetical protein
MPARNTTPVSLHARTTHGRDRIRHGDQPYQKNGGVLANVVVRGSGRNVGG